MASESVANEAINSPYFGDTIRDSWEEASLPAPVKLALADITRAVYGIREITRLLAEDDMGRELMEDGAVFSPMTPGRRWALNHAIKQLIFDAELRLEALPDDFRKPANSGLRAR